MALPINFQPKMFRNQYTETYFDSLRVLSHFHYPVSSLYHVPAPWDLTGRHQLCHPPEISIPSDPRASKQ